MMRTAFALLCLIAIPAAANAGPFSVWNLLPTASIGEITTVTPGDTKAENADSDLAKAKEILTEQVCERLAASAEEHGLPVPFFARLIWQESRFNPRAVSPVGAKGLAQFMPRTAAAYGLENPFDPLAALPASARMLRELRDHFGNLGLAAAAYNGGAGRIQSWLARRGKLPEETRNYVQIITGQPAEKWTIEDQKIDLALSLPPRAPCEGVGGLSRRKDVTSVAVNLTDNIAKVIQTAEAEAARAAAARELAQKMAQAAKSGKARAAVLAKAKTDKPANDKAEKIANEKAGKSDKVAVSEKAGKVPASAKLASASTRKSAKSDKLASAKPSSKPAAKVRVADASPRR
jgi:hypothetical protein